MKKTIAIFIVCITLFTSCTKHENPTVSADYIKFDFRGVSYNLTTSVLANIDTFGSINLASIYASFAANSSFTTAVLQISKDGLFNFVGNYTYDYSSSPNPKNVGFVVIINLKGYATTAKQTATSTTLLPVLFNTTVTKDDGKRVEGTFSGELYEVENNTNVALSTTKHNLTNGTFSLPIK